MWEGAGRQTEEEGHREKKGGADREGELGDQRGAGQEYHGFQENWDRTPEPAKDREASGLNFWGSGKEGARSLGSWILRKEGK